MCRPRRADGGRTAAPRVAGELLTPPLAVAGRHLSGRSCTTTLLPAAADREAAARRAVAQLVQQWRLPSFRSQRWLSAAVEVLAGPGALELFLQYDPVSMVVTLELWAHGRTVFGIDDWLGV